MNLILIAVGGAFGALTRHFSYISIKSMGIEATPIATVAINLLGCFLIGTVMGLGEKALPIHRVLIHLGAVGFLGSFTTFSTLGFESWTYWHQQKYIALIGYVGIQIVLGIVLVGLGRTMILKI